MMGSRPESGVVSWKRLARQGREGKKSGGLLTGDMLHVPYAAEFKAT
jgi:hypothetical protein